MEFQFLNQGLLWGTLACSVPVIIHLFFRKRFQRIPWAAMKFLQVAYRKTKASMMIENLILLLLRILILLLLALIFARPAAPEVSKISFQRKPDHYIVIMDTSYSMGYEENNETSFEKARKQVKLVWTTTKRKDSFVLFNANDRVEEALKVDNVPDEGNKKDELFQAFEEIGLSETSINLEAMLSKIKESIDNQKINKRLIIVSDFQKSSWQQYLDKAGFVEDLKEIRNQVKSMILIDIGPDKSDNLAVEEFKAAGIVGSGISTQFVATIRNFSDYKRKDVKVLFYPQPSKTLLFHSGEKLLEELQQGNIGKELKEQLNKQGFPLSQNLVIKNIVPAGLINSEWILKDEKSKQKFSVVQSKKGFEVYALVERPKVKKVTIPANDKAMVSFDYSFKNEDSGNHHLRIELPDDFLETDNSRYLSVDVVEKIRVLIIDGEPHAKKYKSETGFLISALGNLDKSLIQYDKITSSELAQIQFNHYDVVIAANLRTFANDRQVEKLEDFVKKGGGLFLWLGDKILQEHYNEKLYKNGMGLLPAEILGSPVGSILNRRDRSVVHLRNIIGHPAWGYFSNNEYLAHVLEQVLIYRFFPVAVDEEDKSVKVLAQYNDPSQHPAFMIRKFGKGNVLLFTTTADNEWNSFHEGQFGYIYVTMVHDIIQFLGARDSMEKNLRVGDSILRKYLFPINEAKLTSPLQESRPLEIGYGQDEYLFSLSKNTDTKKLRMGFEKLELPVQGKFFVEQISSSSWEVSIKDANYGIVYSPENNTAQVYKYNEGGKKLLFGGLKAIAESEETDMINVYRIDKKNYVVESQSTDTQKSGIYKLSIVSTPQASKQKKVEHEYFAVNVDPMEGNVKRLGEQSLMKYLTDLKEFQYTRDLRKNQELKKLKKQSEYWQHLMMILLGIVALESFMAMWFARRKR